MRNQRTLALTLNLPAGHFFILSELEVVVWTIVTLTSILSPQKLIPDAKNSSCQTTFLGTGQSVAVKILTPTTLAAIYSYPNR